MNRVWQWLRLLAGLIAVWAIRAGADDARTFAPKPFVAGAPVWVLAAPPAADEPAATQPSDEPKDKDEAQNPVLRKLTTAEISRIRYLELRGMRLSEEKAPDRVQVNIPKDTIAQFLVEMEGHPDFRGERNRRDFLKKTAPQKLHLISQYKGAKYADKVEIKSDPEVFVEFRRQIMPIVLRSCVTSGCHSQTNDESFGFALFNDPKRTPATTYSNFLVLSEFQIGTHRMIDRGHPEDSLLLNYMLPPKDVKVELRHPGDVEFKPVFQSRRAPKFRRIQAWISSLKHPAADYGVETAPPPAQPPDEPMEPPTGGGDPENPDRRG